jgi:hypothetical protein
LGRPVEIQTVVGYDSNSTIFTLIDQIPQPMLTKINLQNSVLSLMIGLALIGVYAVRGLYADGSYILYQLLSQGEFANLEPARKFSQALTQVPAWLAMKVGVTDLNILIRMHSIGTTAMAIGVWFIAVCLQYRSSLFWLFTFAFAVTYLSFGFFAHGEANITCAMVALASSVVLRPKFGWASSVLLLFAAIVLLYAYETLVGLGPLLFIMTTARLLLKRDDTKTIKIILIIANVLFVLATRNAIWSLLYSGIQNMDSALNLGALTSFHVAYILFLGGCIAIVFFSQNTKISAAAVVAGFSLSAFYLLSPKLWNPPFMMYALRVLASPILFGTLLVAAWLAWYEAVYKTDGVKWRVGALSISLVWAVLVTLAVPFASANLGFAKWGKRFEQEALTRTSNTPIEQTNINTNHGWNSGFNWMWTNPSLSILLRGDAEVVILNNSGHTGWQPFDPAAIEKYPLSRFVKTKTLY